MATDAQLNLFNQLMATGDYAGAAQVAQQANYDPADVASYINQNLAGLNLPTDANISADLVQSLLRLHQHQHLLLQPHLMLCYRALIMRWLRGILMRHQILSLRLHRFMAQRLPQI
jgi:hypothetical protein